MAYIFKKIDKELEKRISERFGKWVIDFNCIHYGDDSYSIAVLDENEPIAFISSFAEELIEPLKGQFDIFIDALFVNKNYWRRGIAKKMIEMTEDWAKSKGYRQIRSWSSDDKNEAIPMWYALNYCVCPAIMYGEDLCPDENNSPVVGYYVAKMLNPGNVSIMRVKK